jgi:hypothetical protein
MPGPGAPTFHCTWRLDDTEAVTAQNMPVEEAAMMIFVVVIPGTGTTLRAWTAVRDIERAIAGTGTEEAAATAVAPIETTTVGAGTEDVPTAGEAITVSARVGAGTVPVP